MNINDIEDPRYDYTDEALTNLAASLVENDPDSFLAELARQWAWMKRNGETDVEVRLSKTEKDHAALVNRFDNVVGQLARRVATMEASGPPLGSVKQQVESISGNVERLRDEVRKMRPANVSALEARLAIVEAQLAGLAANHAATETVYEEGGGLGTPYSCGTTPANPPEVEAEVQAASHPFNVTLFGLPLIPDSTVEDIDWKLGPAVEDESA